jgi:D-amino-acid dehydrogenase
MLTNPLSNLPYTHSGLNVHPKESRVKVVVLGAGVTGVATAWYLAEAGHEVTVIDRQPESGLETSFANGGQISACHAEPWANPAVLPKLLKWLGREDAPLVFRLWRWDPALWSWGLRFLTNCTPGKTKINTERTLRVALYSRTCLQLLRQKLNPNYDHLSEGILHIYTDPKEFDHASQAAEFMAQYGLDRQVKSVRQCIEIEASLSRTKEPLQGGIYTASDETGDAFKFTQELTKAAEKLGVKFLWNTPIKALAHYNGQINGVVTETELITGDAYVLALASYSPILAAPLGLQLPIVPAKGYSVTIPITNPEKAPTVSVTDDEHKIVFTRLGDRLRVAGTAEMAGWNLAMTEIRWKMQIERAKTLFPDFGDFDAAEPWAGLRAVTPDSVPILGATSYPNLWLNTGHGTLGWTMACGAGQIIADLISGKAPEIAMDGLGLDRY